MVTMLVNSGQLRGNFFKEGEYVGEGLETTIIKINVNKLFNYSLLVSSYPSHVVLTV